MDVLNDVVETEINTTTPADVSPESTSDSTAVNPEGTAAPAEAQTAEQLVSDPAQQAAPAYTPDYNVKIKGKTHEIPEMFRGLIKDADTEKQVKEFVEKALGIEAVKADRSAIKEQFDGFKKGIQPFIDVYDQFTTLRDNGNLGAAFKVAGISDEQIFEYAVQRLEMEKNPHLAKTYEAQQSQSVKELELQRKVAMYEQQNQQTTEQAHMAELESAMDSNAQLVSQVNAKFGSEDFFRDEVVAYAIHQDKLGKFVSPTQAVQAVVNKYQQFFPAAPQSAPSQMAAPSTQPAAQPKPAHVAPHTIPTVGNGSASPVKKKVSSIDDIRKAAAEANRAG